jgi:hypothetical protein
MARTYSNIALDTTLTAGIGAGDPTCIVTSAAGYPAAPFAIVLDPGLVTEEVCEVTIKAGTTFTITRGFDGTTAQAHALGATVRHSAIAGDFTDLQTADATDRCTGHQYHADRYHRVCNNGGRSRQRGGWRQGRYYGIRQRRDMDDR